MKEFEKFDVWMGVNLNYKPVEERKGMYRRCSRWLKVKHNYDVCQRNRLWDYATDGYGRKPYQDGFDKSEGTFLDYFTWNGRNYAIEQFIAIGSIADCIGHHTGYIEDGEKHYLSGYDSEDYFRPIYIEVDEYGENVRVYEELC